MKRHEGCHPCYGCAFFSKAVVKATMWWELDNRIIDVIIPICIHSAHELATGKCENYEDSEIVKEFKEKGLINENKSNIANG